MTTSDPMVKPLIRRIASQPVQYLFTGVETRVVGANDDQMVLDGNRPVAEYYCAHRTTGVAWP